jgi:hypothetical protein
MAAQLSTELRNNSLAQITATLGSGAFLRIISDSVGKPANCAAATTGVLLVQFVCGTPFGPAPAGAILSPTIPAATNALATGTALYYRLFKNDGTTCVWQDDVVSSGNGLVLNPSNNSIVSGMPQNVNSWTMVIGGA